MAEDYKTNSRRPTKAIGRDALILGYSETHLDRHPSFIQNPQVPALARIAQWNGEDAEMHEPPSGSRLRMLALNV